jgi:hypothetical protein
MAEAILRAETEGQALPLRHFVHRCQYKIIEIPTVLFKSGKKIAATSLNVRRVDFAM